MSRYGRMSFSRMKCQMMRVIPSPSSSTTGLRTLILFREDTPACKGVTADGSASRGLLPGGRAFMRSLPPHEGEEVRRRIADFPNTAVATAPYLGGRYGSSLCPLVRDH